MAPALRAIRAPLIGEGGGVLVETSLVTVQPPCVIDRCYSVGMVRYNNTFLDQVDSQGFCVSQRTGNKADQDRAKLYRGDAI